MYCKAPIPSKNKDPVLLSLLKESWGWQILNYMLWLEKYWQSLYLIPWTLEWITESVFKASGFQGHVKFLKWPQGKSHTCQCQLGTLDFPPILPFSVWSGWMDDTWAHSMEFLLGQNGLCCLLTTQDKFLNFIFGNN